MSQVSSPDGNVQTQNKQNKAIIALLITIAALVLLALVGGGVFLLLKNKKGATASDPGPQIRTDIVRPRFASHETVKFPTKQNFISSGSNFTIREASNTYFAYSPSEHWGVYMFHNDKRDFWTTRHIYCTGWDKGTGRLTLDAYETDGSYVGTMSGTFQKLADGRGYYECVFENYRGKKATYRITENVYVPGGSQPIAAGGPQVYSCAHDGYVVIREAPYAGAHSIGRFRNGSVPATYLQEMDGWTQINYQGIVGWVASRYVTRTPTKAVTVDVDGDSLEGVWNGDSGEQYLIFNNGKYSCYYCGTISAYEIGHYYMEGNTITFVTDKSPSSPSSVGSSSTRVVSDHPTRIEGLTRTSFVKSDEFTEYEGADFIQWTKKGFQKEKSRVSR